MAAARAVVVIVGETTHKSSLVEYEARRARDLGKPVVIAKVDPGDVLPAALYDVRSTWTDLEKCEEVFGLDAGGMRSVKT